MPNTRHEDDPPVVVAFRRGQERWPDVALSLEAFTLRMQAAATPAALNGHGADLFLAAACLEGDPKALRHFDRHYLSKTRMFVGHLRQSSDFPDEVAQKLRQRLLLGPSPKLANYTGAGALIEWLRVVAIRTALNLTGGRPARTVVDELERLVAPGRPPELQLLLSRHRSSLQSAIEASFQRLSPEDRTLLRLQYVDRLGIDQLATIYKTHRATVARRLLRVRDRMLGEVAKDLGQDHGWSPATVRSVWKTCFGAVELSVGRLLEETKNTNA